jgi:hypothetical protein
MRIPATMRVLPWRSILKAERLCQLSRKFLCQIIRKVTRFWCELRKLFCAFFYANLAPTDEGAAYGLANCQDEKK